MVNYSFFEFELAMSDFFWDIIYFICKKNNDKEVNCCVIDPDPIEYYYSKSGIINAFTLNSTAPGIKYREAIDEENIKNTGNNIFNESNVCLWWGSSLTWGIYGIRDYGVSIIAAKEKFNYPTKHINFLNIDEIVKIISLNLIDFKLPENFKDHFLNSYSSSF